MASGESSVRTAKYVPPKPGGAVMKSMMNISEPGG